MSEIINIIGNGESRADIKIENLPGIKIGCNAVYRDYDIDILVAVDRRIVDEALKNGFKKDIYTRRDWNVYYSRESNVRLLPGLPYNGDLREDDPWHWGTGPHAANLAGKMSPQEIHLWGFDLYGRNDKVNNIYRDTENYSVSEHEAVDPRYWIYQLARCFQYYKNIYWIQHQPQDWIKPSSWFYNNLSIENI